VIFTSTIIPSARLGATAPFPSRSLPDCVPEESQHSAHRSLHSISTQSRSPRHRTVMESSPRAEQRMLADAYNVRSPPARAPACLPASNPLPVACRLDANSRIGPLDATSRGTPHAERSSRPWHATVTLNSSAAVCSIVRSMTLAHCRSLDGVAMAVPATSPRDIQLHHRRGRRPNGTLTDIRSCPFRPSWRFLAPPVKILEKMSLNPPDRSMFSDRSASPSNRSEKSNPRNRRCRLWLRPPPESPPIAARCPRGA